MLRFYPSCTIFIYMLSFSLEFPDIYFHWGRLSLYDKSIVMIKRVFLIPIVAFLLLFICTDTFSQRHQSPKNKVGGAIIYNIPTRGIGLDLRAEFPIRQIDLLEGLSVVPQVSYYPWFNSVHEFYIGAGAHLGVYSIETWRFYTLLQLSYNGFINWENNTARDGNFSNFGMDAGLGVSKKLLRCWHPFFEFRFNFVQTDPTLRLGVMYDLKCDRRGAVPCSKIPLQPTF